MRPTNRVVFFFLRRLLLSRLQQGINILIGGCKSPQRARRSCRQYEDGSQRLWKCKIQRDAHIAKQFVDPKIYKKNTGQNDRKWGLKVDPDQFFVLVENARAGGEEGKHRSGVILWSQCGPFSAHYYSGVSHPFIRSKPVKQAQSSAADFGIWCSCCPWSLPRWTRNDSLGSDGAKFVTRSSKTKWKTPNKKNENGLYN